MCNYPFTLHLHFSYNHTNSPSYPISLLIFAHSRSYLSLVFSSKFSLSSNGHSPLLFLKPPSSPHFPSNCRHSHFSSVASNHPRVLPLSQSRSLTQPPNPNPKQSRKWTTITTFNHSNNPGKNKMKLLDGVPGQRRRRRRSRRLHPNRPGKEKQQLTPNRWRVRRRRLGVGRGSPCMSRLTPRKKSNPPSPPIFRLVWGFSVDLLLIDGTLIDLGIDLI